MKPEYYVDGSGLRYSEKDVKYPIVQEEVKTAEAWIKLHCKHKKSVNKEYCSYDLKHLSEYWGQFMNKHFNTDIFAPYVSNGAFIQAAINLDFMPCQKDRSINADFCMSVRPPNNLVW